MLISLIVAFFILHGSAAGVYARQLDQLSSRIKKEVTVEATRKEALALVETADKANKTFLSEQKKYTEALSKVLAGHGATAAQIDSAVKPFLVVDSATTGQMVDLYVKLRPVLGASDWAKVFPAVAPKPGQ
jgi:hypothetical protein